MLSQRDVATKSALFLFCFVFDPTDQFSNALTILVGFTMLMPTISTLQNPTYVPLMQNMGLTTEEKRGLDSPCQHIAVPLSVTSPVPTYAFSLLPRGRLAKELVFQL